mmetsp:Transcript_3027/g.11010  ORF Transcript_3027/g.11010 Transcript_3027/m.11010 type:complete len:112 (-) Transcript_3027:479-814(-)
MWWTLDQRSDLETHFDDLHNRRLPLMAELMRHRNRHHYAQGLWLYPIRLERLKVQSQYFYHVRKGTALAGSPRVCGNCAGTVGVAAEPIVEFAGMFQTDAPQCSACTADCV